MQNVLRSSPSRFGCFDFFIYCNTLNHAIHSETNYISYVNPYSRLVNVYFSEEYRADSSSTRSWVSAIDRQNFERRLGPRSDMGRSPCRSHQKTRGPEGPANPRPLDTRYTIKAQEKSNLSPQSGASEGTGRLTPVATVLSQHKPRCHRQAVWNEYFTENNLIYQYFSGKRNRGSRTYLKYFEYFAQKLPEGRGTSD